MSVWVHTCGACLVWLFVWQVVVREGILYGFVGFLTRLCCVAKEQGCRAHNATGSK